MSFLWSIGVKLFTFAAPSYIYSLSIKSSQRQSLGLAFSFIYPSIALRRRAICPFARPLADDSEVSKTWGDRRRERRPRYVPRNAVSSRKVLPLLHQRTIYRPLFSQELLHVREKALPGALRVSSVTDTITHPLL